jgi:hypothetical protein
MKALLVAALFPSLALAFSPVFDSAEVKIFYPCETEKFLRLEKEERGTVTFFESGRSVLHDQGLILRYRVEAGEQEMTVKYRVGATEKLDLDQSIFQILEGSEAGELKCEWDVGLSSFAKSCAFKSKDHNLTLDHLDFVQMTKKTFEGFSGSLMDLRQARVRSTKWKVKDSNLLSPFEKKLSVEKWEAGSECRLEVSGRIKGSKNLVQDVQKGLEFIQKTIPGKPFQDQSSKTAWAILVNE